MALVIVQIAYGFGRPAYYLTPHQYREFSKYAYGEWLQTFATLMFTKVSICLFLLRITVTTATIRPLQAAVVLLILSNIALSLTWIFQCTPHLDKAWNDELPGKCLTKGQLERIIISQAIISIISDFFLSTFPIIILRKVQIGLRDKVGLCLLMGLGVITGCLSLVRTVLNGQNEAPDATWDSIPNWYWRTWEVFFGISAACIPTLRPGYKWLKARVRDRFTKIGGSEDDKRPAPVLQSSAKKWSPPKPSAFLHGFKQKVDNRDNNSTPGKTGHVFSKSSRRSATSAHDSDFLPLQSFEPSTTRAELEHYSSPEDQEQQQSHYPRDTTGHERREALHIMGDLSTHRPGHLKRLDSEAKVGGGLGAEEVEERI
ncbi:MAG: hypothetical protein LQ350_002832 [Teloschistes chrysophthalmus]|nr:MAG: hypothetical protein LQ350_002832 [Niorma chrysophthalma]